ncbi:helix-turn-helix domain-containing protein [Actinokineospora pegani]|uniref:helix-turn-helix domain-containing protein n=1 Tax=Actinokineospora pegani TaxID=2654637 RepID=UPI0012E9AA73|nr:AraC family transcriptional regulator [Actinokineospora pegani]
MARTRGVLRGCAAATKFELRTIAPSPAFAPFVEHHWALTWDLDEPFEQEVVPHPNVLPVFEATGAHVTGVMRGRFARTIHGRGRVLGVRFHPGGYRPWWGAAVSTLTDRVVPFDGGGDVLTHAGPVARARAAEAVLLPLLPAPDPTVDLVRAMCDRIRTDLALTRVDRLAAGFGTTARTVQRLFRDYVGVGPKWVIRRHRAHEAAARAEAGEDVDWSALAAELGYSDQAHLVREFTSAVGTSPARHARAAGQAPRWGTRGP